MQARLSPTPDMTAEAAFVIFALEAADDFVTHLEATMQEDDPRGPHQARVALRRLRTMLTAFLPMLDPGFLKDMRHETRDLFQKLGRIRDADVLLAAAGSDTERSRLLVAAEEARKAARKRLRRDKAADLAARLEARLHRKGWKARDKRAKVWRKSPVVLLAGHALDAAWKDIHPAVALDRLEDNRLHDLRKDVKAIRYMTESFGPLIGHGDWAASLEALKDLQDSMGRLTDLALARKAGHAKQGDEEVRQKLLLISAAGLARVTAIGPWWRIGAIDAPA